MRDALAHAVFAREDVSRFLRETGGGRESLARMQAYLRELQTTQRYLLYRTLKYILYPLLRKIDRIAEHVEHAAEASRAGRVVYVSNHKSHVDYVVQPLVLDDHGIRQPAIAADVGLFGGGLGLLHRHVTGALPIRRGTRDPLYLLTLQAYVAERLRTRDLLFYPEGGRSYSGALKPPKTGLLQAALQSEHPATFVVPIGLAYDLVLDDRALTRRAVHRTPRPFSREVAELAKDAVGYRSRAFVTFGQPILLRPVRGAAARHAVLDLAHTVMRTIGRLYKVLPTAVTAAALGDGGSEAGLASRAEAIIDELRAAGANLGVTDGREALELGLRPLEARGIVAWEASRVVVKAADVLRFYARTIEHFRRR